LSLPDKGFRSMNVGFKIPTRADTEPAERGFDIRAYINFVWRHWMFISAVVGLALLLALIYLARATPFYTATTQVLLEYAEKAPTDTGPSDSYRFSDFSYIENQLAILASDSLLRRVATKERLAVAAQTAKDVDASEEDAALGQEQSILNAISRLRGALVVKQSGRSQVLNISITWEEPARAAQLANAVADAYVV